MHCSGMSRRIGFLVFTEVEVISRDLLVLDSVYAGVWLWKFRRNNVLLSSWIKMLVLSDPRRAHTVFLLAGSLRAVRRMKYA